MKSLFKSSVLALSLLSLAGVMIVSDACAVHDRRMVRRVKKCGICPKKSKKRASAPKRACVPCKPLQGEIVKLKRDITTHQCEEKTCKLVPVCTEKKTGPIDRSVSCWKETDVQPIEYPIDENGNLVGSYDNYSADSANMDAGYGDTSGLTGIDIEDTTMDAGYMDDTSHTTGAARLQ